ncbi:nonribosomal peptide synthetase-like protein, partial [Periconia macrospinosa]
MLDGIEHDVSTFNQISEDELDIIWNWGTPLPPALNTCMHDLISERARLHPEKFAVEAWDGNLTYAEVDRYSTNLAKTLLLLDDSPNQIIPVLFEKCRWTVVAVLAIMKAGACFALLDSAQPEGRLRAVVQQINATLLIASKTQTSLGARIAPRASVIPVSGSKFSNLYSPVAEDQPKTTLPEVSPSVPMYIQFTSGSTGLPKGCIITHCQYTSGAMPRAYCVGYKTHSRVLDFASYAFDVCIDSMLCTLSHGATLCTLSEDRRMNDLSGAMRDMRVTLAGMTPSVARTLDPDILPQLESIAVGGEGISASDAVTWQQKTTVVNCYGPSECTVGATYNNQVGVKPYISMGSGKGCVVWVTDPADHNKLVPPGAVGELLIEGPLVGNGYLNNPAKTNEVFIEDPAFLVEGSINFPGRRGRIYKTGDLVRYDPDGAGEVIFVGRQDQQVKLRGQRIELAEIEFNMQKHLSLDAQLAVEVIKPGGAGEPTLVAFLVEQKQANGMRHLDGDVFANFSNSFQKALREMVKKLHEVLPVYMVPSAYVPLWKMPLLVSCKTDRKRLREIGTAITRQDLRRFSAAMGDKSEPTTEMELQLGKLWAKVLGGDADFSTNDNFFSMGGDSLRAMKLVAAAREDGVLLSVPDIMLNSTLSGMASKAKKLDESESTDIPPFSLLPHDWEIETVKKEVAELCGAGEEDVEDVYPCTPLQEGLMALSAKFFDAYVAQRMVELPIADAEKVYEAFEKAAAESPILRTRIVNVSGRGLYQVVLKDGELARNHGTDVARYLQIDREEPMELGRALFRYGIIRDSEKGKAHIAITMHHAVYDGWSMPLTLDRVNRAFNELETPPTTSFKHFIKYLTQLDPAISQDYWRTQLEDVSPHQFPPLPYKGYITQADSLLEHYVTVPTTAHSRLTLATIIRGAWALVSSLYLGHNNIVFGETLTGRSASVRGIEQIEGPMITTVPIRVRLNMNRPISEFLHSVHNQTVKQIPHEHLGLQNIRRLSRSARIACDLRTGLVLHPKEDDVAGAELAYENKPANRFLPTDDAEAAREALKFNTYALMLVCTLDENGFLIMASFDSHCISSSAMEKVLKVLDRIVTAFLGNPESKLGDLAVLDESELEDAIAMRPKDAMVDSLEPLQKDDTPNLPEPAEAMVQDLTPNEKLLVELLSRILSVRKEEIKTTDSFFELGGDSISAMRLVSEAKASGLNISVAQIFQSSSISSLAAAAGNEKQDKLIILLSRILNLEKGGIKPSDGFFKLGGDSIGAMRLVSEARSLGLNVTVAQIFKAKSISELASLAGKISPSEGGFNGPVDAPFSTLGDDAGLFGAEHIQPLLENSDWEIADIYPVRPLQKVAVDGTVDLPRYSLRYEVITFESGIDKERLKSACQELVNNNEILRTVFVETNNKCLGIVIRSLKIPFSTISISDSTSTESYVREWITTDINSPKPHGISFVSFTLFNTPQGASTLAFRISHAQYDEMCLPLVFQQLAALYAKASPLLPTLPFTKHVNHVTHKNTAVAIPYWRDLLKDSRMSVYKPDIPVTNRTATPLYREFDIETRPNGITIGSLPTAAWAIVLARRLGVQDVMFGEVVTGRNLGLAEAHRIVGPTWQYAPVRVPFSKEWRYKDVLSFVQRQHVESAAFEGLGLSEIVESCTTWDNEGGEKVDWYDSVVHQAPREWVEELVFGDGDEGVKASFETVYPHAEPLREWKVQAFVMEGGKKLGIEVVTFESWKEVGETVLRDIGEVL